MEFEKLILTMKEEGMGYELINRPIDSNQRSIPAQLAKANRKFQYNVVKPEGRIQTIPLYACFCLS